MSYPPRLVPRLRLLRRIGHSVLLAGEEEAQSFEDPLLADLLTIAAQADAHETADGLHNVYSESQINLGLAKLNELQLLNSEQSAPSPQGAYWDSLDLPGPLSPIEFHSICDQGAELITKALSASGVVLKVGADFALVSTHDYLDPALAKFAEREQPWMLAKPVGHTVWLGPIFIPGRTVCWNCLARAIRANRWPQAAFFGWSDHALPPQPAIASLPGTLELAAGMIANAAAIWSAAGEYPTLEDRIFSFDTRTLRSAFNPIRSWADCPRCSRPPRASRARDLESFISPITGIVSRMIVTEGPVCGCYHAQASVTSPLPHGNSRPILKPQNAMGKGLTAEEAKTGCLAEAVERYSILFRGDETRVHAGVPGQPSIAPQRLLHFSPDQFAVRDTWNPSQSELQWVPEPLPAGASIEWIRGSSLMSGEPVLVPAAYCYMQYSFGSEPEFCAADTNGCASGKTIEGPSCPACSNWSSAMQ